MNTEPTFYPDAACLINDDNKHWIKNAKKQIVCGDWVWWNRSQEHPVSKHYDAALRKQHDLLHNANKALHPIAETCDGKEEEEEEEEEEKEEAGRLLCLVISTPSFVVSNTYCIAFLVGDDYYNMSYNMILVHYSE